jgi:argininosuccinate synthase
MAAIDQSQEKVSGTVCVKLYKGNVTIVGRSSSVSLYNKSIASMDELGGFNPVDAQGFITTQALRLKMAHAPTIKKRKSKAIHKNVHAAVMEN